MNTEAAWRILLDTAHIAAVEPDIAAFLERSAVDPHSGYVSQLVIEEIVRNLIQHTPPYARDEHVDVTIEIGPDTVVIIIDDTRPPFAPEDAPDFDVTAPLEQRAVGGMGLHLVRSLTDRLTYERAGNHNRLTATILRQ